MTSEPIHITVVCLFCGADLKGPESANYSSGDLIKCQECGEHNDYDSVIEVAKEKGIAQVKQELEEYLKNGIQSIFSGH